jgi:hypothetical protein
MACRLVLIVALSWYPLPAVSQSGDSLSRFERIVIALNDAPLGWRAEFANVALSQLLEAYRFEVDLARSEFESDNLKLQRWARTVDKFADQLIPLLVDVEQELPVTLTLENGSTAMLTVAGRSVMLNHPRLSEQRVYEYKLLEQFCHSIPCDRLLNDQSAQTAAGYSASTTLAASPQYQFTEDRRICAYDGIRIVFPTKVDVALMRETCKRFFQEVAAVLGEIGRQTNQSVRVEWDYLRLNPTPPGQLNLLQLNRAGDASPLSLPVLYQSPAVLEAIIPWLSAKLSGGERAVELESSQLRPNN